MKMRTTVAQAPLHRVAAQAALHALGMLLALALLHMPLVWLLRHVLEAGVGVLGLDAVTLDIAHRLPGGLVIPGLAIDMGLAPPRDASLAAQGGALVLLLAAARLVHPYRPAPARVLSAMCLLHALALLWAWLHYDNFPISFADHSRTLGDLFFALLYLLPLPLCMCLAALGQGPRRMWQCAALLLFAMAALLPVQLLLHAVLALHMSQTVLPVLFLFGGVLLDVFVLQVVLGCTLAQCRPPESRGRSRGE